MSKVIEFFLGTKIKDILVDNIVDNVLQIANNKIIEYLHYEYERNRKTKTILHRSEPVELKSFYLPLFISQMRNSIRISSKERSEKRIATDKIAAIFKNNNCVTIVGNAGSGKSTLIKYLFVNAIQTDFRIPIKIELRYLNNYNGSLTSYIEDEVIKLQGIAEKNQIIYRLLSSGQFVIFLDGYDEISSDKREKITRDIELLTKKYPENYYVLTSRPYVNIDLLECFHNYTVCDLSNDEIVEFIKKQFPDSEQELAGKMIRAIENSEDAAYKSFLSNPLLLSMFIITFQEDSYMPQKQSDYYALVFDTLFSRHDTSSKLGYTREKRSGLSKDDFLNILKYFSFKSYNEDKFIFDQEYLGKILDDIKLKKHFFFNNDDIIDDLEVAIGILTQEGLEITFAHRSLQEYFAARFIADISDKVKIKVYEKLLKKLIASNPFSNDQNFLTLVMEGDNNAFKQYLIIPYLRSVEKMVENASSKDEIIDLFVSLRENAIFVNLAFAKDTRKIHREFNSKFKKYCDELLQESKDGSLKISPKLRDKARYKLATIDIKPFLEKIDFTPIINGIETEIQQADNDDIDYINSI